MALAITFWNMRRSSSGVGVDGEILGHLVDQARARGMRYRIEIADQALDERPQIEGAPLELDAELRELAGVFLDHLAHQGVEMLHVAAQGPEHLGMRDVGGALRQRELQHARRERNRVQRRAQIVRHEREILFAALAHLQRALAGEGLHGEADGAVQHAIQNVERPALQGEAVRLGEIVDAAAQDVVLGDDFLDVVAVLDALQAVRRRARLAQRLGNRLVGRGSQRAGELVDELRHMVVERRGIESCRRGQRAHLLAPLRKQALALASDERRQLVEIAVRHGPRLGRTRLGVCALTRRRA